MFLAVPHRRLALRSLSAVVPMCGGSVEQRRCGVVCKTCWKAQNYTDQGSIGFYEGALRETILFLKREPYLPQARRRFGIRKRVSNSSHNESCQCRCMRNGYACVVLIRRRSLAAKCRGGSVFRWMRFSLVRVSSAENTAPDWTRKAVGRAVAKAFAVRHPLVSCGRECTVG
jgi:hypothetical protein